ncbi:MAG: lytic transglycosylase domain-containing protein [Pseudomonadota bacterium]|nr:lytic transglycosylase domain-containing protein [Alphaproteobacteria bacterium]MDP5370458.1 lytic transglycosylase domain-containing protein [Pseudomonadota bacterium]
MFIPIGNKNTYCARSAVITRLRGKCGDPAAFLLDGHVFLRLAITKEALIVLIRFSALFLFACQMHVMAAGGIASCDIYIRQQESFYNIPPHLLKAVSLVESGRTIKPGQRVSWPWTINVNGRGYVYESKQQAINAVRKFQGQGENSIDVGCMQVNLKHHPTAFRHLEDAFDPQLNVAYAAQFLNNLKRQLGSWRMAVAHYHSASPQFHYPYREKIQKQWGTLRNSAGNMAPISHDISYTENSMTTTLQHPLMQHTKHQKMRKPVQKVQGTSPIIAPPGKFYSVNGAAHKAPESYAKVRYRKFYRVLPQNQLGFFPVR